MTIVVTLLLCALALPAAAASLYLLSFTLLSGTPRPPPRSQRKVRFDVVIPAHDEAAIVGNAIRSVRRIDWPTDAYRVIVVADNCTDATAAVARAAGADVLERNEPARRGKGYALDFAFGQSSARGWADAIVVIDADTRVSTNLLEAFAARIECGAGVLQAHYGVLNAGASWRTRLMSIALGAFHRVRSRARERLGLSCGIRGNGWCITHALLRRVPYRAFSLTEDIEYGIDLGLAGHRVHGVDEAAVDATMVTGEQASRSQRQRWESGRWQLIRTRSLPLLRAVGPRRRVPLDLALDLWVMPLSYVVANIAALIVLGALATLWKATFAVWVWIGLACAVCIGLYVLRGWQLSGIGARGLVDLARAPLYVFWKFALMLRSRAPMEWVRTKREDV